MNLKKKLKCVLLVDDDDDCNLFHQRLLNKLECTEKVQIARDGVEALDFLRSTIDGCPPCPSIIFLDINMPRMNGWEFLEEYKKLDTKFKAEVLLIMLTTSLNPDDLERTRNYHEVSGFNNKYLQKNNIEKIITDNFPELF